MAIETDIAPTAFVGWTACLQCQMVDQKFRMPQMLTYMQLKSSQANRNLTQKQRAQIVDEEVARKFVLQAIEETLAICRHIPEGLLEDDLDRIFSEQPVHFDEMGYVPHWFARQDIKWWGNERCRERYKSEYEQKK